MREFKNNVTITGVLVKNGIEEFTTKKGVEAIGGTLVIRTQDGSEHEVNVYANKYKKDSNGNETGETSYFYNKYVEAKENLVALETAGDMQFPSVLRIADGEFTVNDFKGQDGNIITNNKINCKFINVVEPKDLETTVQEAKFEVEGIIESITDEIVKGAPTGDLIVKFNAIQTARIDSNGNYTYDKEKGKVTATGIVPIKLKVDKSMVSAFRTANYYDGCFTKFIGKLINTTEIVEIVEPQAFGEDVHRQVKTYVKKYEIKSGGTATTIESVELTHDIVTMLINKRKEELNAKLNATTSSQPQEGSFGGNSQTTPPPAQNNPFANPFA